MSASGSTFETFPGEGNDLDAIEPVLSLRLFAGGRPDLARLSARRAPVIVVQWRLWRGHAQGRRYANDRLGPRGCQHHRDAHRTALSGDARHTYLLPDLHRSLLRDDAGPV